MVKDFEDYSREKLIEKYNELLLKNSNLKTINENLVSSNKALEIEKFEKSYIDPLTKCHNRNYFEDVLLPKIQLDLEKYRSSLSSDDDCAVGVADLNEFKGVNSRFGHQGGDLELKVISNLAKEVLGNSSLYKGREREVLTQKLNDNEVNRVGGDEFIIYTKGFNPTKKIKELFNRIHLLDMADFYRSKEERENLGSNLVYMNENEVLLPIVSIGVSTFSSLNPILEIFSDRKLTQSLGVFINDYLNQPIYFDENKNSDKNSAFPFKNTINRLKRGFNAFNEEFFKEEGELNENYVRLKNNLTLYSPKAFPSGRIKDNDFEVSTNFNNLYEENLSNSLKRVGNMNPQVLYHFIKSLTYVNGYSNPNSNENEVYSSDNSLFDFVDKFGNQIFSKQLLTSADLSVLKRYKGSDAIYNDGISEPVTHYFRDNF